MAYINGGPFSRQAGGLKQPEREVYPSYKKSFSHSDTKSDSTSDGLVMAASSEAEGARVGRKPPPQRNRRPSLVMAEAEYTQRSLSKRMRPAVEPQASTSHLDGLLVLHEAAIEVLGKAVQAIADQRRQSLEEGEEQAPPRKLARSSSTGTGRDVSHANPAVVQGNAPLERTASVQSSGRRRGRSELHGPCDHCGVKDSPQWRKGPKCKPILCNACGTRFLRTRSLGKQSQIKAAAAAAAAAAATGAHDAPKPIDSSSTINFTEETSAASVDAADCVSRRESISGPVHVTEVLGNADASSPPRSPPDCHPPTRVKPAFGVAVDKTCTPTKSVTFKLPESVANQHPDASHEELEDSHLSAADSFRNEREDVGASWARQFAGNSASTSNAADSSWLSEAAKTLMRSASNKPSTSRVSESSSISGLGMQPSFSVASACAAAGLMPLLSQVVPNGAPTHLQAFLRQQAGLPPATILGTGANNVPNDSQGNKAFMEAAQWRLRRVLSQHIKDGQR